MKQIKESYLHYVWQNRLPNPSIFHTKDRESIEIINPGTYNENAGPDFLYACLKINGVIWFGHIEMHIKSSDWYKHKHQFDPAYDNVILHVVYQDDKTVPGIPVIELNGIIEEHFHFFSNKKPNSKTVHCSEFISQVSENIINDVKNKMLLERFQIKKKEIAAIFKESNQNLKETSYRWFSKNFGLHINKEAFLTLSTIIPSKKILIYRDDLDYVMPLVFGQSGLLEIAPDDYYTSAMKKEYSFFKRKYNLFPMNGVEWKYSRTRPLSFPDLKITQWGSAISSDFFDLVNPNLTLEDWKNMFSSLDINKYWVNHSKLGVMCKERTTQLGESFIHRLFINAYVFFQFFIGNETGAMNLLRDLEGECNNRIKPFVDYGLSLKNASDSQAFYHLITQKCSYKKCLSCGIGQTILKAV